MDVLAFTQAITGVVALALAYYSVRMTQSRNRAEDDRRLLEAELQRERDASEEERRREDALRETMRERPVLVVEHAGATNDGSPLERRLVKVR
jgi:hypothetical protein